MPNKKSRRFRNLRPVPLLRPILGSACLFILLSPNDSAALSSSFDSAYSGFLEPFVAGGFGSAIADTSVVSGTTTVTTSGSSSFMHFGAGLRFGAERSGLFSAVETTLGYANDSSAETLSLGVTAGGNFTYLPLRVFIGLDPYFLGLGDTTPSFAIRAGLSYFLSSKTTLGLVFHHFETSTSGSTSSVNGRSNAVGVMLSMPFNIEQPKEPWKSRYEKREQEEENGAPPSGTTEGSASAPALSDTPPVEGTAPESTSPAAPAPESVEPAPPAEGLVPPPASDVPTPPVGDAAAPPATAPDASVPGVPSVPESATPPPPAKSGLLQDPGGSTPTLEQLESPPASSPSAPTPPTADAPPPPPTEQPIEMLPAP